MRISEIYTSGTTNLFKYPELRDSTEKASELISTFEEKQQLASHLSLRTCWKIKEQGFRFI